MEQDYEQTTTAFRRLDLPKAEWTHLAAGLWFVLHHGVGPARTLMPAAIRRYHAAVGTLDTSATGYHETITQLYLTLIDEMVRDWRGPADYAKMTAVLFEALDDRRIPLRYDSKDRLGSPEARATWLKPDLIWPRASPPGPSTAG